MHIFGRDHHNCENPYADAPAWVIELGFIGALIIERISEMATKEQLDKLTTDVAALINAGVAEINAAIAAAQVASPDPAIDTLDATVTAATQTLTDAAAKLANPPVTPAA